MKYVQQCYMSDMVQALLARRKTQTRRLPNKQNSVCATARFDDLDFTHARIEGKGTGYEYMKAYRAIDDTWHRVYYRAEPGDVVWVRESWCLATPFGPETYYFCYKACRSIGPIASETYDYKSPDVWYPNIHMPKEACRLWLPVTRVRAERLHDISEADAIAEGVERIADYGTTGYRLYTSPDSSPSDVDAVWSYKSLWQSINGKQSLEANPAVWVQEFTVTDVRPRDFLNP